MQGIDLTKTPLNNPPIVEALAQINFEPIQSEEYYKNLSTVFTAEKTDNIFDAIFSPSGGITTSQIGNKLTCNNGTEVLQITNQYISFSHIGKYPGWSQFEILFKSRFSEALKLGKIENVTQVSLRYVNRFKLPITSNLSKFFKIKLDYQDQVLINPTKIRNNLEFSILSGNGRGLVNQSFLQRQNEWLVILDVEVTSATNIKPDIDQISKTFTHLRLEKNSIFSSILKEEANDLFK